MGGVHGMYRDTVRDRVRGLYEEIGERHTMKINPFSKKKQKESATREQSDENVKTSSSAIYTVHVYERYSGNMPRWIRTFSAERYVDEEDKIPYLYNQTQNFLEVFPDQVNDFMNMTEEEVDKELKQYRDERKKQENKEVPDVNFKDLDYRIMRLEAKKRTFKFSKNSTFSSLGRNNIPEFTFVREGSSFFPTKWDLDTRTIYTPSDAKKKTATLSLRNKESKYPSNDSKVKTITWVLFFGVMVLFVANLFVGWKNVQTYTDSEINQLKTEQIRILNEQTRSITETANSANNIFDNIEGRLNLSSSDTKEKDVQKNDKSVTDLGESLN